MPILRWALMRAPNFIFSVICECLCLSDWPICTSCFLVVSLKWSWNWMRLHRVDETDKMEQILYMERRRKFTTKSERNRSEINNRPVGLHTALSLLVSLSFLSSSAGFIVIGIYEISPSSLFSFLFSFQAPLFKRHFMLLLIVFFHCIQYNEAILILL